MPFFAKRRQPTCRLDDDVMDGLILYFERLTAVF